MEVGDVDGGPCWVRLVESARDGCAAGRAVLRCRDRLVAVSGKRAERFGGFLSMLTGAVFDN